jgi:hypothetical protein
MEDSTLLGGLPILSPQVPLRSGKSDTAAAEALLSMHEGFKRPIPKPKSASEGIKLQPTKTSTPAHTPQAASPCESEGSKLPQTSTPAHTPQASSNISQQDVSQLSGINVTGDSELDTSIMREVVQR